MSIPISGNVKMTRPAHDAWGIKKITFNFCDDFLLKGRLWYIYNNCNQ